MSNPNMEEYTLEKTVTIFPKPIPLLRIPIPTNPTHDPNPNPGPYTLAFPNPTTFLKSLKTTQTTLAQQCESGSRAGCSISASKKCTPPFWKRVDFQERAECEEREMSMCLVGSTEKCVSYAQEKCLGPFMWARVRVGETSNGLGLGLGLVKLLGFGSGSGLSDLDEDGVGYVRGSVILERTPTRSDLDEPWV